MRFLMLFLFFFSLPNLFFYSFTSSISIFHSLSLKCQRIFIFRLVCDIQLQRKLQVFKVCEVYAHPLNCPHRPSPLLYSRFSNFSLFTSFSLSYLSLYLSTSLMHTFTHTDGYIYTESKSLRVWCYLAMTWFNC